MSVGSHSSLIRRIKDSKSTQAHRGIKKLTIWGDFKEALVVLKFHNLLVRIFKKLFIEKPGDNKIFPQL